MSDLPEGGGNSTGFWMGLTALITAIIAAIGGLWDKLSTSREKAREQQAKLDAEAAKRRQEEDTATAHRRQEDEQRTIAQWQAFAARLQEEIDYKSDALESKEIQIGSLQASLNSLYRQCSGQEIDITELHAAVVFFHSLAKRLSACLHEKNIPCEEVPDPPPKPVRRTDHEGPDYHMRVQAQNAKLREAARQRSQGAGK